MVYLALLVDWSSFRRPAQPRLLRSFDESSRLEAGAMKVRLSPPFPLMRPSGRYPRVTAEREQDPLMVRALVLRCGGKTLALVLADLMVISDELDSALESRLADLHLDGIVFIATHTHGSVGGYDSRLVAKLALGPYRPDIVGAILDRSETAVRGAQRDLVTVHVRTAETRIPGWASNRSSAGAPVDDSLTVIVLERDNGERLATLAIAAGHPTLFPQAGPKLSSDYPGVTMRLLEDSGGVALLAQGAEGDAVPPGVGWTAIKAAGTVLAQRAGEAIASASTAPDRLAFAEVEVGLPSVEIRALRPFLIRRPISNLAALSLPVATRVGFVGLGDVTLLTVPGEPTELSARQMIATLPAARRRAQKVRFVALAQGYVSYIDTPERFRARTGEGWRAWYGADLMGIVSQGLGVALESQAP